MSVSFVRDEACVAELGVTPRELEIYTTIVLAMLLVFFGVRSYRENVGEGRLTFARGFGVGLLITLVSCCLYVVTCRSGTC